MDFDATKLHPETSNVLFLIRGIPGSGKSTLARILQAAYHTDDWYEADMFFEPMGFDPRLLHAAHGWCQEQVSRAMGRGSPTIIVSNTFTREWEMKPYLIMADACGYKVQEIIMKGEFKSIHNVPEETIQKMVERFEYGC